MGEIIEPNSRQELFSAKNYETKFRYLSTPKNFEEFRHLPIEAKNACNYKKRRKRGLEQLRSSGLQNKLFYFIDIWHWYDHFKLFPKTSSHQRPLTSMHLFSSGNSLQILYFFIQNLQKMTNKQDFQIF